jgi:hypothetical protein
MRVKRNVEHVYDLVLYVQIPIEMVLDRLHDPLLLFVEHHLLLQEG